MGKKKAGVGALGTSGSNAKKPVPKIAFFLCDTVFIDLEGPDLAIMPGQMTPVTMEAIRYEKELGGFGGEWLLPKLKKAEADGRFLSGWSAPRAKDKLLKWEQWDAFVARWCGEGLEYRSAGRKEALDTETLFAEVKALALQGLLIPVGRKADLLTPPAEEKPRKARPSRRRAKREDEEELERDE